MRAPCCECSNEFSTCKRAGPTFAPRFLAGITTFVTLAYILFVNPNILKDAGMPVEATFAATCFASAFATLIMGVYAFFAYAVVIGMKLLWQTALGAVFVSGIIFFLLTCLR